MTSPWPHLGLPDPSPWETHGANPTTWLPLPRTLESGWGKKTFICSIVHSKMSIYICGLVGNAFSPERQYGPSQLKLTLTPQCIQLEGPDGGGGQGKCEGIPYRRKFLCVQRGKRKLFIKVSWNGWNSLRFRISMLPETSPSPPRSLSHPLSTSPTPNVRVCVFDNVGVVLGSVCCFGQVNLYVWP